VYDYWLGGKDNFAPDREMAEEITRLFPGVEISARTNRQLLSRMVTFLAAEGGVRQFVDLGTGIPTSPNLHEVAQAITPRCRVLYVDNDPIVLAHARALLTSANPESVIGYLDADIRDTDAVLAQAGRMFDLDEPVAVMSLMTAQFLPDDEAYSAVKAYRDALRPGSYLAISAPTGDHLDPAMVRAILDVYARADQPFRLRSRDEVAAFFSGLDLVEPGLVPMTGWRPVDDPDQRYGPDQAAGYAAIGRQP
jgi:SAM-dependent methyltransferase